ncbi:carbonic anhydrase [Bordetella avium]|nr:carbonic anhydrase [Bordetella avium]RIQ37658.1 carbonic anhydrase [Bordetella avium]RIQ42216.1 carbonic anhydrase [Bordetella avium]RIQ42663.1 carbonic anhydrase [Bordetella avium]RIQ49126.1 carbonic anhydrase [Bordetella avium]
MPRTSLAGPAASVAGAKARRSPEAALQALKEGHARFQAHAMHKCQADIGAILQRTAAAQAPFAAVLACADSRVPVEYLFDQPLGELFVARVAGNIVTPAIQASLEYAVQHLGIKAIMVLGHTGCGAIAAALKAKSVDENALFPYIEPGLVAGNQAASVTRNAHVQRDILVRNSSLISARQKAGALAVISGVYAVGSGNMEFDVHPA